MNVSTFDSWQGFGKWYADFIAPQLQLDSALRTALDKLVQGHTTDLEKIRAIHQFVIENTHYVGLEFGVYSYKPYPVSQVYARRFGDCKDKASLMVALMRAAGIDADFALVRTRKMGDVGDKATSLQIFDHAIVYVPIPSSGSTAPRNTRARTNYLSMTREPWRLPSAPTVTQSFAAFP